MGDISGKIPGVNLVSKSENNVNYVN